MKSSEYPKILLVEDNYINQRVAVLMLQRINIQCDIASNGSQAFEMYKQNMYDIILMDIQMPYMDGWEATKAIRDFEKSSGMEKASRIIALTASEAIDFANRYREAGMDDFIEKPLKIENLAGVLGKFR